MHEELNHKISELLDDELSQDDALELLRKLQLEPELQDKLNRYEAISYALKAEVFLLPKADFSTQVSQRLKDEPSYLLPKRRVFSMNYPAIALAASIAALAVFVSWDMIHQPAAVQPFKETPVAQAAPAQTDANIQVAAENPGAEVPLNQRINDYLQAHNNSVYTNGEANFKPYTQVTAYSRE